MNDSTMAPAGADILIAEDSPTQAARLKYTLEQNGYHVRAATNGAAALKMAEEKAPTLIISDVNMPEMGGYELSRRVKAHPTLDKTPLILVTTMSDPEDVIRGLECGADNFILKPYEEQYLLERVRHAIYNREMRRGDDGGAAEIYFNGERHVITADRRQAINLLLSTYDAAMQRNKDLKASQDALQALNGKLEEANRELESFSYSVSHDLRAPLRHIDGYAAMLTDHMGSDLSEDAGRFLGVIRKQAQHMRQLIEDLLSFSRTNRAELREGRVDLNDLVATSLRDLEMQVEGRNIEWKIAALPAVAGDYNLLRQVYANLLSNAVKYSRPRDPAHIEVGVEGEAEGEVTLYVRDDGVGFDMKYSDKLFGVFQRLHHPDQFEGTGIGLANVRRIIVRHNGRIWAEAALDQGSTFYFTLKRWPDA